MAYDIGPKIGIDGETQFRKNLRDITQSIKTLGSEMKAVSTAFDGQGKSLDALKAKNDVLQRTIDAQKEKVKQLAKGVDDAAKAWGESDSKTQKWRQALYEANAELNRMENELEQNEKEIRDFGKSTENVSNAMDDAGKKTSIFADVLKANLLSDAIMDSIHMLADGIRQISDAATGFLKDAVSVGSEFDHTMSGVAAISGATGEAFDALREEAIKMGGMTKFSANEAAEALNYMAMAGWDDQEMIGGLKGIMDLAAASGTDLARTSDIVTDAMTAFGLEADKTSTVIQDGIAKEIPNVTHFADVLAQVSASANTNVDMLGESFKYVAPTAGALGYAIEDVAVALGLMANQGIKETRAGTALNTLLTNMAKPTKDMQGAMNLLGVSLDDGAGHMYSFAEVMRQLRSGFSNIQMPLDEFQAEMAALEESLANGTRSEKEYNDDLQELMHRAYGAEGALKAEAAAMLSGKEGMAGLLAIVNSSDEDFEKLTKAINEASFEIDGFSGAAERMAKVAEDNLQGDLTSLNSAMETLKIRIADELTPTFRDFAQFGVRSVRNITAAFEQDGLSGAIDALGQQISEGMVNLAERVPEMMEIGGQFITSIGEGIAKNLPRIRDAFVEIVEQFQSGLPDLLSFGEEILSHIADGVMMAIPNIADAASQLMRDFGDYLRDNLPDLLKQGLNFVLELSGTIRENAGKIVDGAIALAKNLAKGLADSIPTIVENIPTIVSNIAGVINDNAPKILAAGIEIIITLVKGLIQSIPVIIREMPKIIKAIWDTITAVQWVNLGKQIISGFKNGVIGMINDIKDAGKRIAEAVKTNIKNLPETLKGIGRDIITGLWKGISEKIEWLSGKVSGFISQFTNWFTGPSGFDTHSPSKWSKGVFENVMLGAGEGIADGLPALKTEARRAISSVQAAMTFGENIGAYTSYSPASGGAYHPASASGESSGYVVDEKTLTNALKNALAGVGVYASGQKIGALVDRVQRDNYRATGYI